MVESKQKISDIENDPAFDLFSLAVETKILDMATEHDHYLIWNTKAWIGW